MVDHPAAHPAKSLVLPSEAEIEATVRGAKVMFDRVLGAWASDVLMLRRSGLDRPRWCAPMEDQDFDRRRAA